MTPLQIPILAILTDRTRLSPNWTLAQALGPAVSGGANLVIYAEQGIPPSQARIMARFASDGVKGRCPFVVWNDPDLAARIGASGVHFPNVDGHKAVGQGSPVIPTGVTITSKDELRSAQELGATYILAAFDWKCPNTALAALSCLTSLSELPLLAALDPPVEIVPDILAVGAGGVVICEPAMAAYDRTAAVRNYANALGLKEGASCSA